jgi:ankyrin repeat protein
MNKINSFKYLLLVAQANFKIRDNNGLSTLDYAAKNGNSIMINLLMQMGDDPN